MLKLAANRKGITGRLFSAGYKYFSKAPGSATSSSSTPKHRYNTTTCSSVSSLLPSNTPCSSSSSLTRYPHQSQEAQTRRLADFSFMLGDDKFASQMYDYLRKDAFNDQGQYDDLTSGLIYEQVARIVPPRQAALYTILAAHRYASAEQNWLSKVCLQQAPQFVGWARIEDYVVHKMTRMAELDADWPAALVRYWNVLRQRILSGAGDADDDELYLTKFRALYPRAIKANPSLELPRIEDISLFDVERCKICVPHQNHLRAYPDINPAVWEELGARCPGTPGLTNTPNEPSTAAVNVRNPLQTSINVTQIQIQVANPSSDPLSNLEIDPVNNLELLPLETRE
ncbi:hypothetical protein PtA15_17A410 [Puccinia triticina]|uniref:Uncharacterized protein n=1 Tax=Puccinia triticina TaxID=208348 RepID=A0ABY7D780_9BASI|nr:uncharacterized protein PtA15_17A410 [Puccinia triticina]WAQ92928.1 hypothetical protein PtA15_17A410 [Puccinia triticina]